MNAAVKCLFLRTIVFLAPRGLAEDQDRALCSDLAYNLHTGERI